MVKVSTSSPYSAKLDRAMNSVTPPVQVRTLAKDLRPDGVESMRRLIRRFLTGERTPGPQVAGEIVAALQVRGADTSSLESDDEEEAAALYRDLLDAAALEQITKQIADRMGRVA